MTPHHLNNNAVILSEAKDLPQLCPLRRVPSGTFASIVGFLTLFGMTF
jgi:hypothetical protein